MIKKYRKISKIYSTKKVFARGLSPGGYLQGGDYLLLSIVGMTCNGNPWPLWKCHS